MHSLHLALVSTISCALSGQNMDCSALDCMVELPECPANRGHDGREVEEAQSGQDLRTPDEVVGNFY